MKRFSKILNREISEDEVFEINNYGIAKSYTDLRKNDTIIYHIVDFKFKFDFSDLNAIGKVIYMKEIERTDKYHTTKCNNVLKEDKFYFKTVETNILKLIN